MKQKERVVCPECGHRHTITVTLPFRRAMTVGVRARRITGNQFEYSLSGPTEMLENDTKFLTVYDDLILSGAVGGAAGALCGLIASTVAPDYAPQIIGAGFSAGVTVAWGWLCAEHNTRLKRVLPWFMEQKGKWATPQAPDNGVQLVIDHRYRDGLTEHGRTIQYFGTLPVDVERFNQWAQAALRGDSLAINKWTPESVMFTRKEYDALLAQMKGGGTITDLRGNKGNVLTGGGRRALARHLKQEGIDPPTPPMECA